MSPCTSGEQNAASSGSSKASGGGISSAVARSLGAGDQDKADALALHAVVIVLVFGLVCSAIVIGFAGPLYGALGGQGAALDAAGDWRVVRVAPLAHDLDRWERTAPHWHSGVYCFAPVGGEGTSTPTEDDEEST